MAIKVSCPKCAKVINAPDAAKGKVVKCPGCETKIRIPGGEQRSKKAARPEKAAANVSRPDSTSFLINLKSDAFVDRKARICPKCGVDVGDEDIECPECGVNLETGQLSAATRKLRSRKGPNPAKYYREVFGEGWRFWKNNLGLTFRTIMYLTIPSTAALACFFMVMWCTNYPPKTFWFLVAFVFAMVGPGWLWFLDVELIRAALEKKKKLKRIRFDIFQCAALGIRSLVVQGAMIFPLIGLSVASVLMKQGQPLYAGLAFAGSYVLLLPLVPIVMSHMAMPVSMPGMMIHKVLRIFFRVAKPALLWATFAFLSILPAAGSFTALAMFYTSDIADIFVVMKENTEIYQARKEVESKVDASQAVQSREVQAALARNKPKDVPWKVLIIPTALWCTTTVLLGLVVVFNLRTNAVFTAYFHPDLDLIAEEPQYVYVSRSASDFVEERASNVMIVWVVMALSIVAVIAYSTMIGSILISVLIVLGVIIFFVPFAAMWRIFEKMGEPGWGIIRPKIVRRALLEGAGLREWYWTLMFFLPLINTYVWAKCWMVVAKRFGRSESFGLGLAFAPFIFHPMLGFSRAKCLRLDSEAMGGTPKTDEDDEDEENEEEEKH